jgi:hypothetical protein
MYVLTNDSNAMMNEWWANKSFNRLARLVDIYDMLQSMN